MGFFEDRCIFKYHSIYMAIQGTSKEYHGISIIYTMDEYDK